MPFSSYVVPLTGSAVLMTVTWCLGRFGYSVAWIGIFVALNFFKTKLWKQREKRLLALRQATLREKEVVMAQMQDLPAWVQFPDTERVEWINKVIMQAWPYIGEYVKQYMKENIEPTVKANLPRGFKSFRFEQMDMGDIPLRVGGIKVYTENVGRDRIIIDSDVAYAGDCEFVVGVGSFKAGLNQMQFQGKLRAILMPLIPYPPMVGGVSMFFLDNPTIDFNLTGMGEMVELPGLMGAIRSIIDDQVANICVLPNEIVIPLVPNLDLVQLQFPEPDQEVLRMLYRNPRTREPDGVIRIHVVEARNLENKDISTFIKKGKSDPYAVVTVGAQVFKTAVIDDNLNPVWHEFYEAVVDQASGQRLRIELYDEDMAGEDEELGRLMIDLSTVQEKGMMDEWFPLESVKHGELHLKLYWLNLTHDPRDMEVDQWESEWLKANRPMHPAMLMIYVDHASDLPFPKLKVEPSPIIQLKLANETKETFPKWKTINPLFQQKFIFFVSKPETETLHIEAVDQGTKRSLGECDVSLNALMAERNLELYQHTFSLNLRTHMSPLVMTVRLRPLTAGTCNKTRSDTEKLRGVSNLKDKENGSLPNKNENDIQKEPTVDVTEISVNTSVPSPPIGRKLDDRSPSSDRASVSSTGSVMRKRNTFMKKLTSNSHILKTEDRATISSGQLGRLHLAVRYSLQTNRLVVNVYRAMNLRPVDEAGLADPYVQVKIQSSTESIRTKFDTKVAVQTLDPVFEEQFEFEVNHRILNSFSILCKVKDGANYGIFNKPPILGKIRLPLANFDINKTIDKWFDLERGQ